MVAPRNTSVLLGAAKRGDAGAAAQLMALLYDELKGIASRQLARERRGHTLQTTALVNEAYLRLTGDDLAGCEDRRQFFAAAAEAMRRILVEHARARRRQKRGGGWVRLELADLAEVKFDDIGAVEDGPVELLALHEALERLEGMDDRLAEIVKLRCFVGLSVPEVAAALGVSTRTVDRDWVVAKAWLKSRLVRPQAVAAPQET